ncbi:MULTISPECIES: carbohydrate ABC transporter permease [Clostridium]|jgi:raffinose/stachyose/melibiose transport system permease protein|uniref:ABC transporter permease n=3 Tax=root TaxID=1 RepID=A0A427SKN1_CLOBU|nr:MULTISPECIES: carbohydrate ABC transporter permease [Clostridium]MDU4854593.1 carbohydrate ABC transporter permease [Clostridioides difficile]ALP90651.1 ABC transporter permease [Clostridium butyricum]ANF14274.1 ABC transporter permease [Clostridium butyricum]AOR94339.1 ABC transporter permease [Clostridium butyricum]AXB85126.1 carbohydrate ABC transporter permease [Clostridium butyricum]
MGQLSTAKILKKKFKDKDEKSNWPLTILMLIGTVTIIFPLIITVLIALKSPQDMMGGVLSLPEVFHFENFKNAIEMTNFFNALKNSLFITITTVIFTVVTNSMVGYAIARNLHKKSYKAIYYYFISAMFVPFPIIMLPLVKQVSSWNMDNIFGVLLLYIVYGLSSNVFLYVGFLKAIPKELEEAAFIDGASTWQVFFKIVFPMCKPMHATVAIMTALWCWNDVMLPLVILSDPNFATIPLVQFIFQSQFGTNYNLAFASYLLALIPILLFYLFAQKWIISGVTKGAIK